MTILLGSCDSMHAIPLFGQRLSLRPKRWSLSSLGIPLLNILPTAANIDIWSTSALETVPPEREWPWHALMTTQSKWTFSTQLPAGPCHRMGPGCSAELAGLIARPNVGCRPVEGVQGNSPASLSGGRHSGARGVPGKGQEDPKVPGIRLQGNFLPTMTPHYILHIEQRT